MDKITSKNIDASRWYFLIIVVYTHIYKLNYQEFDNLVINWLGFIAVCGFIFISGYVNYDSLKKNNYNKKKFFISRLKRIMPMYIVSLLFSFLVIILFEIEIKEDWFYNFIFMQSLFGFETIISNESLWSMPYEIALYIILCMSIKSKILSIFFLIITLVYSLFSSSFLPILFLFLFAMGCFLSFYNIKLNIIKLKFFKIKNLTYEIYLMHYPLLLIYFFKIIPILKNQ